MSELKTNKITPVTGTNVVMGDSGDSFTLAAGATASGFLPTVGSSGNVLTSDGSAWASTAPAGGGAWTYISSATASSSASLDFTSNIDSTYDLYVFVISNIIPATDQAEFYLRTTTNASTFDSGSTDYQYASDDKNSGNSTNDLWRSTGDVAIQIAENAGNGSDESMNGFVHLFNPSNAATKTVIEFNIGGLKTGGQLINFQGMGCRNTAADVDGVQFLFSTGNITSGTVRLYGVINS